MIFIMYMIKSPTLGRAHELVIERILKYGRYELDTEENERTVELPEPSNIHVENPFSGYMVSKYSNIQEKFMNEYVTSLLEGTEADFVYTYHDRLFHYDNVIDQIDLIIKKLRNNPTSRRAQAITWYPEVDAIAKEPPCLQRVQYLVRDGRLNQYLEFRSNDMLMAAGANMYALAHLQKYVADELGLEVGWYEHTSVSAHIYYIRDHPDLMVFVNGCNLRHLESVQKYL